MYILYTFLYTFSYIHLVYQREREREYLLLFIKKINFLIINIIKKYNKNENVFY